MDISALIDLATMPEALEEFKKLSALLDEAGVHGLQREAILFASGKISGICYQLGKRHGREARNGQVH